MRRAVLPAVLVGYVGTLQDYGAIGGSLYDLVSTGPSLWPALSGVPH